MTFEREYARRGSERDIGIGATPGRGGAVQLRGVPGKSTLVEHEAQVHTAAARGTAGPGGPLPHLATIQRCFGRHDVTGIAAHTGGAAAEATAAIGAEAFATGHHVAFGGAPSLHTAAHEAAHVIQQRAGVSLKGGVGQAGDPHEQHADAVADRVVRGESAEALLDAYAGSGGAAAIQRMVKKKTQKADDRPALLIEYDEAFTDGNKKPRAKQLWELTDALERAAPQVDQAALAKLTELAEGLGAAHAYLSDIKIKRPLAGNEVDIFKLIEAQLAKIEEALPEQEEEQEEPEELAAEPELDNANFQPVGTGAKPKKKKKQNAKPKPVTASALVMRVCMQLGWKAEVVTKLPVKVQLGGIARAIHLTAPPNDAKLALDAPTQIDQALTKVHITIELHGAFNSSENPHAYRDAEWTPKFADGVGTKQERQAATQIIQEQGAKWDAAVPGAIQYLINQQKLVG